MFEHSCAPSARQAGAERSHYEHAAGVDRGKRGGHVHIMNAPTCRGAARRRRIAAFAPRDAQDRARAPRKVLDLAWSGPAE